MTLTDIVEAYEEGHLSAGEALEMSSLPSLVDLFQAQLDEEKFRRRRDGMDDPMQREAGAPMSSLFSGYMPDRGSPLKSLADGIVWQALAITAQTTAIRHQTDEAEAGRHSMDRLREAVDKLTREISQRT